MIKRLDGNETLLGLGPHSVFAKMQELIDAVNLLLRKEEERNGNENGK